jgi:uncharacterized protein
VLSLIGVFVALIFVVAAIRGRKGSIDFGLALIIGALIVGIFALDHISVSEIPKAFIEASIYSFQSHRIVTNTAELALLMTLIFVLARAMQETGAIAQLIHSLRTIFSKGGTLGIVPAVYGMMPVIGGALLSAPMIDEEGSKYLLNREEKNFINMWFRHIWLSVYPISSAMILICSRKFSDIDIFQLIRVNIPAFIAYIVIGIFFLKRMVRKAPAQPISTGRDYKGLRHLLPPIVPVLLYGLIHGTGISQTQAFTIGAVLSIFLVYLMADTAGGEYLKILSKMLNFKITTIIFGIMIFREMFEVSGANIAIIEIANRMHVPAAVMLIAVPMLISVMTGYNLGSITLSYFLVKPLFPKIGIDPAATTSLIFMSAQFGYLISPVHMCNILSSEYLRTDMVKTYRFLLPATGIWFLVHLLYIFYSAP